MSERSIWAPIEFDEKWNEVKTDKFDNIFPSWKKRREELQKYPEQYKRFIDQLKRKQAIDTGIIEKMYDLKRGVTETFIKEGFIDSYLSHGDTDITQNMLMDYLRDNFEAIDFIFDFVKNNRDLSLSYIKELHSLITRHQDSTEAIDPLGKYTKVPLQKGAFKKSPNNPMREGISYNYCPPEQVEVEMDKLIAVFNDDLDSSHVLVKAAFLHHGFTQIHPFQDGNGRIARLLASFVLIKEGLFPLTIDRDERTKYIGALESADNKEFQPIIELFAGNQITSIERALNWKTMEDTPVYDKVVNYLVQKLDDDRIAQAEKHNKLILSNMNAIFEVLRTQVEHFKNDLAIKLKAKIETAFCSPNETITYYYQKQIIDYAKKFDYYVNLSLNKCWGRVYIEIDDRRKYRMIFSIHHYGYDNSTFAIGAFLSKAVLEENDEGSRKPRNSYIDTPIGIPPLTISTEKAASELTSSIKQQVEISFIAMIRYIAEEV